MFSFLLLGCVYGWFAKRPTNSAIFSLLGTNWLSKTPKTGFSHI
jgi:hypothetical protein